MKKTTLFILVISAFILAACGSTPENTYNIRPLKEAYANAAPEIVEVTATDAVLLFESSVPLACSVVYGTSTEYGQLSVDTDMDGGAHSNHHPVLSGLEPDTEYQYRLQGTASDGTIYVSENMTFRTLPLEEGAEVNLASLESGAAVTDVSSNFGGAANDQSWGANSALDGNRATAWSSSGDGNDAFIEITLPQAAQLSAVEVWTRSMSDGSAIILSFTITTDSGESFGPFTLDDAEQAYRFEIDTVATSLRLDVVESTGGNTGLVEFAAYGNFVEE